MATIILSNDFHGTSIKLRLRSSHLSEQQTRRSWRALCGIKNCSCGNIAGMRGPQTARIVGQDYSPVGGLVPVFAN